MQHSLLRNSRGVTAIEFAMLLPVMLVLICGSIELGYVYMARMNLEGALIEAARLSTASQNVTQNNRDATMRGYVQRLMGSFMLANGRQIVITTQTYSNFSSASPEHFTDHNGNRVGDPPYQRDGRTVVEFDIAADDRNKNGRWDAAAPVNDRGPLGGVGDVVSYTARFPVKPLFHFLSGVVMPAGGVTVSATTVMRNEPIVRRTP